MTAPSTRSDPALPGGPGRPASGAVRARPTRSTPAAGARRARAPLAVGVAGLAVVTTLAVTDPYRPGGHLVCPVLALTGLYCAGCGAQRAVHSLAHGELGAAWDMNPLAVLLAPVLVLAWVRWLHGRWRPAPPAPAARASAGPGPHGADPQGAAGPHARRMAATAPAWLVLVAVVAFAVLRNLPGLAPVLAP